MTPEAYTGGLLALVHEGDVIDISLPDRTIELVISDDEMTKRKATWTQPEPRYKRGTLAKYARLVSSASEGAVTS
jgi:dihydroxy-acid dehydratase